MWVRDDLGNNITGASVSASASSANGGSWSGTLSDVGGGFYAICNVGSFNGLASAVTIDVSASKAGYQPDTGSGNAARGNLYGCP